MTETPDELWRGYIVADTWAGRCCHPVSVIREARKRFRIRFLTVVTGRTRPGDEQWISKAFVRRDRPTWAVGDKYAEPGRGSS